MFGLRIVSLRTKSGEEGYAFYTEHTLNISTELLLDIIAQFVKKVKEEETGSGPPGFLKAWVS
ncbi:hypothetical protein C6495_14520 [Candidatus Poribacteria bacterium]|nr:MAG: hypothetical protein C6495_14520 [Candidatus Poribacteria bacterium]